jgi:hypothetical protein
LQFEVFKLQNFKLQTAKFKLQTAKFKLQTANCKRRITSSVVPSPDPVPFAIDEEAEEIQESEK